MVEATHMKARHTRSLGTIAKAAFAGQHARALINMFRLCDRPVEFLRRYLTRGGGSYPDRFTVRTPTGPVAITVHCPDDLMTINEIFFRGDYPADTAPRTYVDFGSNIGISTLYWLTRNPQNRVYCYEPLPQNLERLKQNLAGYEDRYTLNPVAVGLETGTVEFGWEPTGRYGGVGLKMDATISVPCVDSNEELQRIVAERGEIGVLKIDIESMERRLTARIPEDIARKIVRIVVESDFEGANPLAATHRMSWRRPITRFERIS